MFLCSWNMWCWRLSCLFEYTFATELREVSVAVSASVGLTCQERAPTRGFGVMDIQFVAAWARNRPAGRIFQPCLRCLYFLVNIENTSENTNDYDPIHARCGGLDPLLTLLSCRCGRLVSFKFPSPLNIVVGKVLHQVALTCYDTDYVSAKGDETTDRHPTTS